jgi:hypothetical protein
MKTLTLTITLLTTLLTGTTAHTSDNIASACATLELMAKMTAINALLPANYDKPGELHDIQEQLKQLNTLACQPVVHSELTQYNSTYANGRRVSADLHDRAWHFANGQLFTARPGRNSSIYYPNGQVMAYSWMRGGQTIYWPNGNPATFSFRTVNEAWYYPDGYIVTYLAGVKGARWFYPFDNQAGQIGQEMISADWGEAGEHFNLIEFTPYGQLLMRREKIRGKLVLSDNELLDVPGVLLMLTRLYQAPDEATLFIPGDGSITGVPY